MSMISEETRNGIDKSYLKLIRCLGFTVADCRPRYRMKGYKEVSQEATFLYNAVVALMDRADREAKALEAAAEVIQEQKQKIKDLEKKLKNID